MKNKLIVFSLFIICCITLSGCKSTSVNYPSMICPKPFSVHGSFDLYLLHSAEDVTMVLGECMHADHLNRPKDYSVTYANGGWFLFVREYLK